MRSLFRTAAGALVAVAILCGAPARALDQQVSAAALKAAFLANFAKFTEWPDDALTDGQTFSFCVIGDRAVADALIESIRQRRGAFNVTIMQPDGTARGCHLLYVGGTDTKQAVQAIEIARGLAIFTAGEAERFAESGGVAQLVQDHGRMRFAINPASAQRARLVLSAQLLNLAILVKDIPNASR